MNKSSWLIMYLNKLLRSVFIIVGFLFIVYPIFFSIITSLKSKQQYIVDPIGIDISSASFTNFLKMIKNFNFLQKLCNTSFVVFVSLVVIIAFSIPTAYVINTFPKRKKFIIDMFLFSFMFIPEEVLILPEYNLMARFGLINNYLSVILLFVAESLPESIFLIGIYFRLVPASIVDAARIDGASEMQVLYSIVIPLSKSPITVVCVNVVIALWNSFLIPMIMLYEENRKLLIPSLSGLITKHSAAPTYQMAGTCLSLLPLIAFYLVFKRQIFENSIGGAINYN